VADQVFEHLVGKAGVIRRVAAKVLRSHARVKPVVGESIVERPLTGIQDCHRLGVGKWWGRVAVVDGWRAHELDTVSLPDPRA